MKTWYWRQRIHTSWLVAAISGGATAGVIVSQYLPAGQFVSIAWLLVGLLSVGISLWRRRIFLAALAIAGGMLVGLWRGSVSQQDLLPYSQLIGASVTLQGTVSEDTEVGKRDELVLRLQNIRVANHRLPGTVWVSAASKADIKRGDSVQVNGKLAKGFGSFAASMYRAELAEWQRPYPGDVARQARDGFADQVRRVVAEPQASLGIGYLVGQRRGLPTELEDALRLAGLTHIVVASGYNLTILVRLARRIFAKVSKYMAAFASGLLIASFVAVTGASPSMSRAGLVAGLSLLAWYYGRKIHPLVLLPLAAAITLLVNPAFGRGDLGWQLSFAAFAGVMVLAPLAQRYFFGDKPPGTIRQILGETIAAQACTLPILIAAFGAFSNVAIVANLLVLPLVPLAMLGTFMAGIAAMLLPMPLAQAAALPVQWLLSYMTTVAEFLAKLPWVQTTVTVNWLFVAAAYVAVVAMCVYMWRKTRYDLRESNIVS